MSFHVGMFGTSAASMPSSSSAITGGTGYGGDASQDARIRKEAMKKAAREEENREKRYEQLLSGALKTLDDIEPDEELISLLKQVLRNHASSTDSSSGSGGAYLSRKSTQARKLYQVTLDCCDMITKHHPKYLGAIDDEETLLFALQESAQHAEQIAKYEQDSANAAATSKTSNTRSSSSSDMAFVQKILSVRDEAHLASKAVIQLPEMSVIDPHEHYRQALRPLRFEIVENLKGHVFAKRPKCSTMDMKRLFRELTTYKTNLPIEYGSSIFVRAMENRLDLLRACIIGPDDTPYANGAFIFDIYLHNYPHKAPQVKYLTTGGGKYRFNPNLYNDGKVCLSLLGTWKGPGWVSGESTLLQVLISIQSLILVPDPYFNEPGYQQSQGTPNGTRSSEAYNSNIRYYTTSTCLLPFLNYRQQPSAYPEFDSALALHFRNKASLIKKQLHLWWQDSQTKKNNHGRSYVASHHNTGHNNFESLYYECLERLDPPRKKDKEPVIKTTLHANGVIEIDDDEPVAKKSKQSAVVVLLDDDDDDGKLPAAAAATMTEGLSNDDVIVLD